MADEDEEAGLVERAQAGEHAAFGLLVARYGKGLYIYNGYAFFRQLPAGVPGAVRLYVNLLSASAAPAAAHGKR